MQQQLYTQQKIKLRSSWKDDLWLIILVTLVYVIQALAALLLPQELRYGFVLLYTSFIYSYPIIISTFIYSYLRDKRRSQQKRERFASIQATTDAPSFSHQARREAQQTVNIRMRRDRRGTWIAVILTSFMPILYAVMLNGIWQTHLRQGISQPFWALLGLTLDILVFLLIVLLLSLWIYAAGKQSLTASEGGLTYRTGFRTRHIPWSEARLLAIVGNVTDQGHAIPVYELSSATETIRWSVTPYASSGNGHLGLEIFGSRQFGMIRSDLSPEAYHNATRDLLITISQSTSLPLHDLR